VVLDPDAGVLVEANWDVLLLLRPKEGTLKEPDELGAVKPNKLDYT